MNEIGGEGKKQKTPLFINKLFGMMNIQKLFFMFIENPIKKPLIK